MLDPGPVEAHEADEAEARDDAPLRLQAPEEEHRVEVLGPQLEAAGARLVVEQLVLCDAEVLKIAQRLVVRAARRLAPLLQEVAGGVG